MLTLDASDYSPRAGDIMEGPARAGRSVFLYYPEEELATRAGGVSVAAVGVAVLRTLSGAEPEMVSWVATTGADPTSAAGPGPSST